MTMDLSNTIQPKSDQLDAVDLSLAPRTFQIERISKGTPEQPVNLHLSDFPRPWRPGLSMRRVLVTCWGADAAQYVGRRVTLYCDPDVQFGGQAVGGIRISHLSDIAKAKKVPLLVSRGKSAIFLVQPLIEARPAAQPAPTNGITPDQMTTLMAAMKDAGLTVKDAALAYLSQTIGRDISASRELTAEEADLVIHELQNEPAGDES